MSPKLRPASVLLLPLLLVCGPRAEAAPEALEHPFLAADGRRLQLESQSEEEYRVSLESRRGRGVRG